MKKRIGLVGCCLALVAIIATSGTSRTDHIKVSSCFGAASGQEQIDDRLPVPEQNPANRGYLEESSRMNDCMGSDAELYYSPTLFNAFADPNEDQVVLGEPLVRKAERDGPDGVGLGMGFILAHEYGHVFQFTHCDNDLSELGNYTPHVELQADVLAGYWAGARVHEQRIERGKNEAWEETNQRIYTRYAASFGDFAFDDPSHHGTPSQRRRATARGFDAGQANKFGTLEETYSDNEDEVFDWSREVAISISGRAATN